MAFWQVTYNGVTKDAAAWGISGLKRKRKSAATDTVTFKLDGTLFDTHPLPFPCLIGQVLPNAIPMLSIARNGRPWFTGIVTKPEPKAKGNAESIDYEISGPWIFLEKTQFQQMWVTTDASSQISGQPTTTISTTRSNTILGQSFNDVKMNSGQVIMEVLLYAQYSYQMVSFPSVVTAANLPPAPPGRTPFQIGALTPSIVVPYSQVRDKSCADIIRLMMKYTPDAVAWMDYSTSPPTLNIDRRANLANSAGPGGNNRTISLYGSKLATEFNPTPRYDLLVPVVVAKFEQKNTINGEVWDDLDVQVYPPAPPGVDPNAWASQPFAWVQTVDLLGSQTTQQSVDIKVISRPISINDTNAMNWVLYKEAWLKQRNSANANVWDYGNISMVFINTAIDPNDPLNDPNQNPNNITISGTGTNDCPQLVAELLTGDFPPWLQEDPNDLDAAKVMVEVWLQYTGGDAATAALFTFDPNNPTTPTAPGGGFLVRFYNIKATNADTETYSQLTSWSAGEPAPTGFAQYLWQALSVLHFQGSLTLVEQECSDMLPPGCVFNTVDGNPDWQTMIALVLIVTEDIDKGTTEVEFGPPQFLSLDELEDLFRANIGLLPSFKLDQRTTGKVTAGSNVIGAKHTADTNTVAPPAPASPAQAFPFEVIWRNNPGDPTGNTFQAKVQLNSNLLLSSNLYDTTPITGLDTWFALDANDTIWLLATVSSLAVTPGTPTIHSYSMGNTDYSPSATPWTTGGITENDGNTPPNQTLFRKVIATSVADAKGKPSIKQYVQTDMVVQNISLNGEAAIYPYPL